jgi:hypothetical protein
MMKYWKFLDPGPGWVLGLPPSHFSLHRNMPVTHSFAVIETEPAFHYRGTTQNTDMTAPHLSVYPEFAVLVYPIKEDKVFS